MIIRCPGQDNRNIRPELVCCLHCGYNAEIFTDEVKITCPNCKNKIYRHMLPNCIKWCKSARECIGEKKWLELKGGR